MVLIGVAAAFFGAGDLGSGVVALTLGALVVAGTWVAARRTPSVL